MQLPAAAEAAVEEDAPAGDGEAQRRSARPGTARLDWAGLLKRTFKEDVLVCNRCGGRRRVVAYLTHSPTARRVLQHLGLPADAPALARDARVVYIGTFSKVLFPVLRVGYLVIPTDLVDRFSAVREAMDICPPALNSAVLLDFIAEGHFARHLRRTSVLYRERRTALVEALRGKREPRLQVVGAEAGLHLVALLDRPGDLAISRRAAREGLWAMPLSACDPGNPVHHGLVLGYGGTSVAQMPDAVERLRRVLGTSRLARRDETN